MSTAYRAFVGLLLLFGCWDPVLADEPIFSGTAFVISDDGWLLTNAHVVSKCTRIEIKGLGFSGSPRLDETNDFAALKVTPSRPIAALRFRRSPIRLGEDIVAIGFPLAGLLSDSIKVTTGNVNALAGIANDTRYIQISTPIQPGNSGGPVVDNSGTLIGITTATLSKNVADKIGITAQNVNFAVRSSVAELFLQSQGIAYQSLEADQHPATLSTADLADKITPSVFPVFCYGKPAESAATPQVEQQTSVSPQPVPAETMIDANGYDAIGFDYATLRDVPLYTCRSACANDSQCMAFTYNTHYNVCFLKGDVVALIRNGDATSGYSSRKSSQVFYSNFTVFRDVDVPGGDYRKIARTDYLQCFMACLKDDVCRAFAYVRRKNECWLKNSLGESRSIAGVELGIK